MKIYVWGQRNNLGGGIHYNKFTDALKKMAVIGDLIEEVDSFGSNIHEYAHKSKDIDTHILFSVPNQAVPLKGNVIVWAIFESDILPQHLLNLYKQCHLVWVPSDWGRTILIQNGIDENKIDVVPEGVDSTIYHPYCRDLFNKDDIFRFYMFGKKEDRKGYKELLDGFKLAFGNDPKVHLCLKADNQWKKIVKKVDTNAELQKEISDLGLNNIKLLSGELSANHLSAIYNYCDAFVFPSRSEGWGLPLIEALACGMPTISTYYSGHTGFLAPVRDKIICLNHELQEINSAEYLEMWPSGGNWAVTTPETIASALCEMKDNISSYKIKAQEASNLIRANFSWDRAADIGIMSLINRGFMPKVDIKLGGN